MHSFTFDGVNSRTYCDLFVSGGGTHNAPERDIESVSVPGRNGDLTIDHGRYKNITVSYDGWILGEDYEFVRSKMDLAKQFLCSRIGYKRLTDDYYLDINNNPIYYRMARLSGDLGFSVSNTYPVTAVTSIKFDCMPQRWRLDGEIPLQIASSSPDITYNNPTAYESLPLITIQGVGPASIAISGIEVKISELGGGIILDSEIERAYWIVNDVYIPKDNKVILTNNKYPRIPPNEFTIEYLGDGITSISIVPRWWTI